MNAPIEHRAPARPRIVFFDTLRGLTIISMVAFHAAYDAAYLYGPPLPWFTDPIVQNAWRISISWVFLLLAGWMTQFSRDNLHRGIRYAIAALVVYVATSIASVDTAVSFGILFCMAASTLAYCALRPLLDRAHPATGLAISLSLFALTYSVPSARYGIEGLAWLGFPSPAFASGDYYPLLPYCFMYLAGMFAGRWFERRHKAGYPRWMTVDILLPLTRIGQLSLPIYLLHQPALIALFTIAALAP